MKIYLYIKTHNITGLKYFGKTTKDDVHKYKGSGLYWKRHIKIYGYNVSTEIIAEFSDIELCKEFALNFSIENDIINSEDWANIINENGLDGAPYGHVGHIFTDNEKLKMSEKLIERWECEDRRKVQSDKLKKSWENDAGRREEQSRMMKEDFWTPERRKTHSEKLTGRTNPKASLALKGKKKPDGHGDNVSKALKGVPKTEENIRAAALGKQRNKKILIDHNGCRYELHSEFFKKYNIAYDFLENLDAKVRYKFVYDKLGISYTNNKEKTKRELGFRFE